MSLELVSFNICPFVQRSVITLLHKQVEHDITYIDLSDPPSWFVEISPLEKVPLLKVDGDVLFESAVINEYVDETTGQPLMPADPLLRAKNRAWIEFGSNLIGIQFRLALAEDSDRYDELAEQYRDNIAILERNLESGPYFNGESLSLVDAAYAPVFMREKIINQWQKDKPVTTRSDFPKYAAWSDTLLGLPEVQRSVVPDFDEQFLAYFRKRNSFALAA